MISVGIDVSKDKSTVSIMKPGGEVLKTPYDILHTKQDLLELVNLIKSYDEEVKVVLESTGQYHFPVVAILIQNEIFVCCVNALRMKRFCFQSLHRAKNDKIDATMIAVFGLTYWDELTHIRSNDDTYNALKLLARQYYQTLSVIVKLTNFVERYYPYEHILEMGKSRFFNDYCKWAKKQGYRMYERRAKKYMPWFKMVSPRSQTHPLQRLLF